MKTLIHAVKSRTVAELLNHTLDASMHIRNDKPSLNRFVTSLSQRATICTDKQRGYFQEIASLAQELVITS
jgi:hypothetical protein